MTAVAVFYQAHVRRDLDRGGSVTLSSIRHGATRETSKPTGIVILEVRQTGTCDPVETVFLDDAEFPDRKAAVVAWARREGVEVMGVTI